MNDYESERTNEIRHDKREIKEQDSWDKVDEL